MARMSAAVLLWFGLLLGLKAGHGTPTTTMAPSSGKRVLKELHEIKEQLHSMQQAMHSGMACGSNQEPVTVERVLALETKVEAIETVLARDSLKAKRKGASTFVRWGRKTCGNSSDLVYTGIVGGSHYSHSGAAANPVCLTLEPQKDSTAKQPYYSLLYGAEYQHFPKHHDHDVPCSVCRVPLSTTIMLPGTQECPTGWTAQYAGYLTAGYWNTAGASQFVCLDKDMEDSDSEATNQDGYLFFYTHAVCGSLRCPPYENNQVVLCVVCSN